MVGVGFLGTRNGSERGCEDILSMQGTARQEEYVRFSLIRGEEVMPLQDVTAIVPLPHIKESAEFITAWLNSDVVYRWLAAKGHARGGVLEFSEAPLMRIPFRRIDFENPDEEKIHQKIKLFLRNNPIGDT